MVDWALRLWPGGQLLWQRGSWSGLCLALGFAALLNLTLITTFGWTEMVRPSVRGVAWLALGLIWVCSWLANRRWLEEAAADLDPDAVFRLATDEYLRGDLVSAERRLRSLVRQFPNDAESRLMLATLLRHGRRWDEAQRELDQLVRLEEAAGWQSEIAAERRYLREALASPQIAWQTIAERAQTAAADKDALQTRAA